jgi:hypothetical protein
MALTPPARCAPDRHHSAHRRPDVSFGITECSSAGDSDLTLPDWLSTCSAAVRCSPCRCSAGGERVSLMGLHPAVVQQDRVSEPLAGDV